MKAITIRDVLEINGMSYQGNDALFTTPITGVAIDSRNIKPGDLFVPIRGERFDGHDFIDVAYENGAVCVLTERMLHSDKPFVLVPNTIKAYQRIAAYYRSLFTIPIIGITGSVGKSTTKEMTAAVLCASRNVCKSPGNLNNQTGVPQSLLMLEEYHEAAVIEMGTNHFGEIDALAAMVKPNYCVLTNIGTAHIEHLQSQEGILRAKCEMLPHMQPGGKVFACGDDALLLTLKNTRADVVTYGLGAHNDVRAEDIREDGLSGAAFTAVIGKHTIPMFVPAPGAHMIQNALCAAALGLELGLTPEQIVTGLSRYAPLDGRMCVEETPNFTILNDVYNANPSSMRASIDVLAKASGRKVCILGDMLELGKDAPKYHKEVGEYAAKHGAACILCVGELSQNTSDGAKAAGAETIHFQTQEALLSKLEGLVAAGDTILVKASRGMQMEHVVEALRKERRQG